jgi:hypothetical protein
MHTNAGEVCRVTLFHTLAETELVRRIRAEFREMPGMRITPDQAQRLWSLDRHTCDATLQALLASGFLARDAYGRYMKAHGGY